MRLGTRQTAVKIFASVVLVGGAASVAGLGTFGSFTSTTSASENVATGKVVLSSTAGTAPITVAATNMVPGDNVQRTLSLSRAADTETFGSISLTTTNPAGGPLTADTTNGLQLKIDQCADGWVKAANGTDLTCASAPTTVLAQRPVIGATMDLAAATTALNTAGAANLRITLTLPTTADNTFQGKSATVGFTFDATQRAAKSL